MTLTLFSEKRVSGFITILLGLLSLYEGKTLFPYSKDLLTGDHFFPGLIGILLVLFGLALFFEKNTDEKKTELPTGETRLKLISTALILMIYCFLIMFIGYVVGTLIVSICFIKVIGKYRWITSFFIGGALTTILYFLFIVLLKTPFPSGYFTF
jgi:putative tricarboxylic transport membrane protein